MDWFNILIILENIVFWSLVIVIAWYGSNTSEIVFMALFIFLIYWALRIVLSMRGFDRAVGIYTINIIVTVSLLYYFLKN